MKKVFIKPIEGALIRHPVTMTPLPIEGMEVDLDTPNGTYWLRRIADGSAIIEQPKLKEVIEENIKEETKFKGGKSK